MCDKYDFRYELDTVPWRLVEQMQPLPFRTFRTEFHMSSASEVTSTYTTTTHYSQQYVQTKHSRSENGNIPSDQPDHQRKNGSSNQTMHFSEIKSLKRVQKSDEGSGTDLVGILNPFTGKRMSIQDAIEERIFDVRTGLILASPDGDQVTIEEAERRGLVDPSLARKLSSPWGGDQEMTLLETIQRKLYEAEFGLPERKHKVSNDSISKALSEGRVDVKNNTYQLDSGELIDLNEALSRGYLTATSVKLQTGPLTLTDALNQGLVEDNTGWIVDRNSGNKYQVDAACKFNIIDSEINEIVNSSTGDKISLIEALQQGLINPKLGKFVFGLEKLSFEEAKRRLLISKPKSLKDLVDEDLINEEGLIQAPFNNEKLTVEQACVKGLLDVNLPSILDFRTNELVSLQQALKDEIITNNRFKNLITGEEISIQQAVNRGYLISVVRKSIFEVDGFQPPDKTELLSFNRALAKGYISTKNNGSLLVNKTSGKLVPFSDLVETGEVIPEVYNFLTTKIGIFDNDRELNVLQAVFKGIIEPKSGNLIQHHKIVYLNDAIAQNLITAEGASILNSLLNLNVTTKLTKTLVQRYVAVTSKDVKQDVINYSNALSSGLIDNERQVFVDPDTKEVIPIVQAISEGRLAPDGAGHGKSDLPCHGWSLRQAIDLKLFDDESGLFQIPGTDRLVSFEECLQLEFINPKSGLVVDPTTKNKVSLDRAIEKKILDSTGHYLSDLTMSKAISQNLVIFDDLIPSSIIREEIPAQVALEQGLINSGLYAELTQETPPEKVLFSSKTELSEADKTRARITIEPTYKVTIGRAQSLSPDREAKKVVLQKLRKKIVKPSDAVTKGLVDSQTASLLEDNQPLCDALEARHLDGNSGRIKDSQRGDLLNINEAISRGLIDPAGSSDLLVPLNRSLSIPELFQQGLIDPSSQKVVHPETGAYLTLSEAIICDIVDPLSTISQGKVTLKQALDQGVVDEVHNTVQTQTGNLSLDQAVEERVFDDVAQSDLPPAGMTFPVALKRGLIDPKTNQIIHPITGEKIDLTQAINSNFLMTLPFGANSDSVKLDEALELNLIDSEKGTFKHPITGELYPISQAVEEGLLVIKPQDSAVSTKVTKTIDTLHKVTTLTFNLAQGYALINKNQVQNLETNEIISLDEARALRIVEDLQSVENTTKLTDKITFSEALNKGLVDMQAGTYTDPQSGVKIPIKQALTQGSLVVPEPSFTDKIDELDLAQAYDTLYDPKTGTYFDPKTQESNLTFKQALDREIIDPNSLVYDVQTQKPVSLEQAVQRGLIDEKTGKITDSKTGKKIDFKEATKKGLIAVLGGLALPVAAPVLAGIAAVKAVKSLTKSEPAISLEPKIDEKSKVAELSLTIDRQTTALTLNQLNCYDLQGNRFVNPFTGDKISFEEFVFDLGVIDPDSLLVKDLRGKQDCYISLESALKARIIDRKTGYMVDPKTGKKVTFFEALAIRWIIPAEDRPAGRVVGVRLDDLCDNPEFNLETVRFSGVLLGEAVKTKLVDPKSVRIQNQEGALVPYYEALDLKLVDSNNTLTIPKKPFEQAFKEGLVRGVKPKISLEALIVKEQYNPKSCQIIDLLTQQPVTLEQSLQRQILDGDLTLVQNRNKQLVSLNQDLTNSKPMILNGLFEDPASKQLIPLNEALKLGLIQTKPTLFDFLTLIQRYYDCRTGQFLNPLTGDYVTLSLALKNNLVDPKTAKVKDSKRGGKIIELQEAIECSLVNSEAGLLTCPELTLDQAFNKGYVISTVQPSSLQEVLAQRVYEPQSGLFNINSSEVTLEKAIEDQIINPEVLTIKEPKTGDLLSLNEAINKQLVDPVKGTAKDLSNNSINLYEAQDRGLLLPYQTQVSLPEAINKGLYNRESGKFIVPKSKEQLETLSAINRGFVDPSSTLVTIDEEVVTFEQAIHEGIVNTKQGLLNLTLQGDPQELDFVEALDLGVLVEVRPPISLSEALNKGLYDPKTQLFLDPHTGNYLTLVEAIEINLIDAESCCLNDQKTGSFRKIPLLDAIHNGIVDGISGTVKVAGKELTLGQALEQGFLLDVNQGMSLQKAIHQGLYDEHSGKIIVKQRKISLHEAMRSFWINPRLACYFNRFEQRLYNLNESVRLGLVDKTRGVFVEPFTERIVPLNQALEEGLIVDIETGNFGLYELLEMKFYDPESGLLIDPSNPAKKLTLSDGLDQELVNPLKSVIKNCGTNKYVLLPAAIDLALINPVQGTYLLPNNKTIDLIQAKNRGLIVTSRTPLGLEEAINNFLYRSESGKFADPLNGEFYDLTQALSLNFINPATTALKEPQGLKSLPSAIIEGRIDVDKGRVLDPKTKKTYNFDVAFQKSLLVTLQKPFDLKAEPLVVPTRECSLDQAISLELIKPEQACFKGRDGRFVKVDEGLRSQDLKGQGLVVFDVSAKPTSQVVVYEGSSQIYLVEPSSMSKALEDGSLDLGSGKFVTQSKISLSLKDAISLGYLDPDTALIKDLNKNKLVKLPEGFRKGLVDAEKGNVLDTSTSKLYTLKQALDLGLVVMPQSGFSLLESLSFGLYNPTTGCFTDPFTRVEIIDRVKMTLTQAIDSSLIDPTSSVVKDTETGGLEGLLTAIESGLIDAKAGRLQDKLEGRTLDFVKAQEKGLIMAAAQRQAVEEKYKLCDDMLEKLLHWIGEVEDRLASQDVLQETEEDLRNQINTLKQVRDDLDQHSGQVAHCSEQVRQLVLTAGDFLSKSEVSALEKRGQKLRNRFDKANERSDKLLKKLISARDELSKLKGELNSFARWLDKARRELEEKERSLSDLKRLDSSVESTKEFVNDVIAHQADLRFITMSAQKFVDEGKEFLNLLNDFRTSLPSRLPHIEPYSSQESPVRNEVSLVTQQYRDLLHRANMLSDRVTGVGGKQKEYLDALDKARAWLRDAEPRAVKLLNEQIAGDPKLVEDQLTRTKSLNSEFIANSRLINNAKLAVTSLLNSLEGLNPKDQQRIEGPFIELQNKYEQLCQALANRCQELDTALVQSQGVQDALDGIIDWLNLAENNLKGVMKPASLIKERLDEQLREHRILQSEIDSHISSIDSVYLSASELIVSSSNARVAKKIEVKLNDVKARFDKLFDRAQKRGEFLGEVNHGLVSFLGLVQQFELWYSGVIEVIESRELAKVGGEEFSMRMREIAANREEKRALYEEALRIGRDLLSKRDVTDTAHVRDKVKTLETQWKELGGLLDEKARLSKLRSEQLNAYENLQKQVVDWLSRMENKVSRLETICIDLELLKKQSEELKPISKEYKDFAGTIDKINDLGSGYDGLSRADSPSRRRYSPTKRVSLSARSPSPTKGLSPLSPGGSSGFSSRRSSQDGGFHLEELSPIQQQLSEINNRYSLLGVKINDRQSEIDLTREELKKHLDSLRTLAAFLDKVQRQLPKDIVPNTKEEADKINKQIRVVLEEMYEKQSLLDSTKSQVKDLLKRKQGALGADSLNDELEDVVHHWKNLSDHLKNRIKFMEDMKEFHDTHDSLSNWLSAKDRMLTVLGPISSDSRMVQSQVQQVQVLREEFRSQQPQLQHLIDVGDSVLSFLDAKSPDHQKINGKLANVQRRWAELLSKLEERADSLGAAADTSREFDAQLTRLRDALQGISDGLDELPLDKDPEEQLRKVENLERQLEGQRPLLADLEAAGGQLCEVLSDPASRADIQSKLGMIDRQYKALQKKLDLKKAEIEGSLRDGRQFEESCAKTLGWLGDELGSLSERLLVSAIRDVLEQQVAQHEPIYRDVLAREHEVIMLLNKGRDLLAKTRSNDTRALQRDLDKIQTQWDKLRKETGERHTRLQTCKEHCRKYYSALEAFCPWLRQAEDKLDGLRPSSFQKKHLEKQLKELQAFRNEVWKKSGEFENTKGLGEGFSAACDIDKEVVKGELTDLKDRWDKLNNYLLLRTQSLEDQARKLADFNEHIRDLQHGLERCEDKLQSHDSARDPKLLDRIKALREECDKLRKPLQTTRQLAEDLVQEAGSNGINAHHLRDEVDGLGDRLDELQAKLNDRCSELQSAATAVTQFNEQVKGLGHDLSNLEGELDQMAAPGRDLKTVKVQIEDVVKLLQKIARASDDVNDAILSGERLVDSGFAPDTAQTRQQVDTLKKQLGKLDDRAHSREKDLDLVLKKLQDFYQDYSGVLEELTGAGEQVKKLKPVGSDVDSIRAQQSDFKKFRAKTIEPLSKLIDNCNKIGQGLIQSASSGVNTAILEKDLEKMNYSWNELKQKINDRERRLDLALLQSGKFQEALDGLDKWLTDTEELVANQKPPSADYKVVKAQLQEQKFLKKMLMDRQTSMSSLYSMGNEIVKDADPQERKAIEKQLRSLMGRFEALTEGAQQRTLALEQAMRVAKEFQDQLMPLQDWLDRSEKKVKDMELVPPDEEKIQQRIREHDALHHEILNKKPEFSELADIASNLMSLVGEDEATILTDKLQEVTDRYGGLVLASEHIGDLLTSSRQGLRHLVLTYQDLASWMDVMEQRLGRHKVLAVHTERLLEQMDDLTGLSEEISSRQNDVDGTVDAGVELMRHISSDEALHLKDKLDSLQRRYNKLTSLGADLLKRAEAVLPLVQKFHENHSRLVDWMQGAESVLQSGDPREGDIARLELDLQELRPVLETINLLGPQLCTAGPGEGAATIEGLVSRDNRRFDAIAEQIQRRAERIHLGKQRALEVTSDIDELLEWFREVEGQIREADRPWAEPDLIRIQLKEHKALNDDISSQKGRVRDVISTAKKVLRESPPSDEMSLIREKMEDLREIMDAVSTLSSDRLGILEQALPLAEHFHDTHVVLANWLNDMEQQVSMLAMPSLRPDLIAQQQDRNELFLQSISEHKPLLDKLNKTGEALIRLCNEDDGTKVQELLDSDNSRYNALRAELRERQQALEQALQESSQFSDKLEGMLRALSNTADQITNQEPISAHPPKIRDQIDDNEGLVSDLNKRNEAYNAVKRAADDVINKAGNRADPAIKDIKRKLDKLKTLWEDVQKATQTRGKSLDHALQAAQQFWKELHAIMVTLKDLEDSLTSQEPPAVEPKAIQQQQVALQEIRHEIDQTKPEVEQVKKSGKSLMQLCGEPDKPEVKKHIEDLDNAWDNITALYAKREENLIDAMEKAMEFHETLQNLLAFLDKAEGKFEKMGPLGTNIDAVKRQIDQLNNFKAEVDPHMVKVEALNRQAQELTERSSADQATAIKEPLAAVNKRWDKLLRGIVERQRQLENALLRLGQFQHALNELLVWIGKTEKTLDELKPVAGDPQILEIELAKLKVLINDIQAHQTSVDTLNDAGRQIIESGEDQAFVTQEKLNTLNTQWRSLMQKAADKQRELEDALNDAQRFNAEIQDLLAWLGDVDGIIAASKPVGGLPETASEQLERFMEIYNEIEENRPKVETILAQGQDYLKKGSNTASNLQHNLRTLKQRWESVTSRANDKKIKLEIALKEATEFHESLQSFVDWLTNAEKVLSNLKPVSRVLDTIQSQIEDHKVFQKDVGAHREVMLNLDKKGTHLKYFSQKQDVILIKNLLISVQHRWERVASKSAERTRALDLGYKEAKEFHDSWSGLMNWLDETEHSLEEAMNDSVGNNPEKIKSRLAKHQEFQRALSGKQATYDNVMKAGKQLKDKAPKNDEPILKQMLIELKNKWNAVCNKSVERQRKLEEALLYSGQFKDAIAALLQWLKKVSSELSEDSLLHGDLDTVNHLVESHRLFEKELERRNEQMESVIRTGHELERKASPSDAAQIRDQLNSLNSLWDEVSRLTHLKSDRLKQALKEAELLHKSVNMILDWLSEAEMKLRFVGNTPEDEATAYEQLRALDEFRSQLTDKEVEKDQTLSLAQNILSKAHPDSINVIKNWIKVIQSRWEEVSQWALQRHQKLTSHMQSLRDLDECLEELIQWLLGLENTLIALKREELPMDIPATEQLIADHKEFMENTQKRQLEVERVYKAKQVKSSIPTSKDPKKLKGKPAIRGSQHDIRESSPDTYGSLGRKQSFKGSRDMLSHRGSRSSPGRELSPDPQLPHVGPRFPPAGSEPEFRAPRVKFLYDKWRHVWMLSWERQRELNDHLAYLKEKEKADNFSWDSWRKRFLKFMNYKKSRLTDLFRKIDKDNNELIPRDDFIDGIIRTKFDTSKLEMEHVADMFDLDNRGLIDWKKFIAALRPDWEEKAPDTDAQKIHDEVKRLVMLCTCRQKFRVFQVGEGKYRFGESQKLRLVRILRSTVMVRVGGGWVALDEFLVKNDPCRAKGRTNIELREQFILADGVSQTMTAFKPKTSASSPASGSSSTSLRTATPQGPITKVRERSARSVPMGSLPRQAKSSLSAGTPDSLSDNEASTFRTPRRPSAYHSTLTPGGSRSNSRPASRTGSRPGSKPASRYGSNQSLDSTDDTPSRIPRRTTPMSTGRPSSTFGSGRKSNGATPSGSRPRTPSGLISPASPAGRTPSKPRQVTIGTAPTLRTASRTRTPSGSNTPVSADQPTAVQRLLRRPSGASDTPTGQAARRKTSLSDREPFRL